jgi:hypothetical protein
MKKISYILLMMVVLLFYSHNLSAQNTAAPGPDTTTSPKKIMLLDNDLGSKLNPVKCDRVKGETDYLERLRDQDGNPVIHERIGHAGPTPGGHYYDKFLVKSQDGQVFVEIYLDMYCPGYTETDPIKEFQMDTAAASSQAIPQQKSVTTSKTLSPSKQTVPAGTQKAQTNLSKAAANSQSQGASNKKQGQKKPGKKVTSQPDVDKIPGFDDVPDIPPSQKNKTSSKVSAPPQKSKTTTTSTAAKSSQGDTIPGFDDVPSGSTTVKKGTAALNQTYLSRVPILDPSPGQPAKKDDTHRFTAIINQSVNDYLKTLEKGLTANLLINQDNHTIHDKKQEIKELYHICAGKKDPQEKIEEITKQVLDPQAIDLIITGTVQFEEQSGKYLVTPIVISKSDNKLFMSKIFDYNSKIKQAKIEKDFRAEIIDMIKKEFPRIFSTRAADPGNTGSKSQVQPSPLEDVYVSIIPFFDPGKLMAAKKRTLAELLEEIVIKEVEAVKNSNGQLEVNASNHTIHDEKDPVKELNSILSESNLKDSDKADKIINDMMVPKGIDYIFTVVYSEDTQNNIILVRPHVISKKERKIFSMNLVFQKDELLCPEAQTKEIKLCESAGDNIGAALRMLLGQSIK